MIPPTVLRFTPKNAVAIITTTNKTLDSRLPDLLLKDTLVKTDSHSSSNSSGVGLLYFTFPSIIIPSCLGVYSISIQKNYLSFVLIALESFNTIEPLMTKATRFLETHFY